MMKLVIPILLLGMPVMLATQNDGCESEPPPPEPIGMLHSEPGICDGSPELVDSHGSSVDSGWIQISAVPDSSSLIVVRDDCTDIEEHCTDGLRLQGSLALGEGVCHGDSNGVSTSGINLDSGFMGLCSKGDIIWVIIHDDCGGLTDYCPTGYTEAGDIHVGSGGCDGFPSGKDWKDQPLDSGWMALCVENNVAETLILSSDCI